MILPERKVQPRGSHPRLGRGVILLQLAATAAYATAFAYVGRNAFDLAPYLAANSLLRPVVLVEVGAAWCAVGAILFAAGLVSASPCQERSRPRDPSSDLRAFARGRAT